MLQRKERFCFSGAPGTATPQQINLISEDRDWRYKARGTWREGWCLVWRLLSHARAPLWGGRWNLRGNQELQGPGDGQALLQFAVQRWVLPVRFYTISPMDPGLLVQGLNLASRRTEKKPGPTMGHTLKSPISPVTKSVLCLQSISLQRLFSVKVFEIGHFTLCKLKRELPSPPFVYQICLWLLHLDSPASDSHFLPPRRVFICQTRFLLSQYRLSETILVWLPSGVWVIITEKYPLALNTHCLMAQLSIRSFAINWMGNVI